jgi:L-threonylcarbamoyladenylate synthase
LNPIIKAIDSKQPDADLIAQAVQVLRRGGIVAYPTRCLYGLAADALNPEAVDRVYRIKGRPADKALSILIPKRKTLGDLVADISSAANALMDQFWPGDLTLLFRAKAGLPRNLTAGTGKIGIRLPAHPVAKALVEGFGGSMTATSANLSGGPGCFRISDFHNSLMEKLDMVLDAGPLEGGMGSTIVDVSTNEVSVLREGVVSAGNIFDVGQP